MSMFSCSTMVSSINIILPALVAFSHIASAHFTLDYPAARGFDEDLFTQFPCGGQNEVTNRTLWPLSGGEIALNMRDASANVKVLIGFGNDVGSRFETVLRQTFADSGTGTFCMTGFQIPAGLSVTDGMNATIQVITGGSGMSRRGDASGGLYNCADIALTRNVSTVGSCSNATDIKTSVASVTGNPNSTTSSSGASSGAILASPGTLLAAVVGVAIASMF
ncbi:GPI anchored protein [Rutstroemia sp. NJR-2017a BVV2]|nr:GPI anchored protein [Rutstroemia sp. NJR-2017a BVV2]